VGNGIASPATSIHTHNNLSFNIKRLGAARKAQLGIEALDKGVAC
jgi:hypothetical protein